jgi:hypothetical protein
MEIFKIVVVAILVVPLLIVWVVGMWRMLKLLCMKHQTPSTTPKVFITESTIDRKTVKKKITDILAKKNIENGGQNRFSKEDGE